MKPVYTKNRVVGLLGGSFNPAHVGHLHISEYALKKLGIDCLWWLVSPQNPLKSTKDMASYKERFSSALKVTRDSKRIIVSDFERRKNIRYTYQTIDKLQKAYKGTIFVWIMGADNLAGFHNWQRWKDIAALVPIVVFDRFPYSFSCTSGKSYSYMKKFLNKTNKIDYKENLPQLYLIRLKKDDNSSTDIRKKLGKMAFFVHN
ncbi:MAG: nicotinate (nicotinamide) nucleotide adenylyltransferase [Rickettsiales bacterium]